MDLQLRTILFGASYPGMDTNINGSSRTIEFSQRARFLNVNYCLKVHKGDSTYGYWRLTYAFSVICDDIKCLPLREIHSVNFTWTWINFAWTRINFAWTRMKVDQNFRVCSRYLGHVTSVWKRYPNFCGGVWRPYYSTQNMWNSFTSIIITYTVVSTFMPQPLLWKSAIFAMNKYICLWREKGKGNERFRFLQWSMNSEWNESIMIKSNKNLNELIILVNSNGIVISMLSTWKFAYFYFVSFLKFLFTIFPPVTCYFSAIFGQGLSF